MMMSSEESKFQATMRRVAAELVELEYQAGGAFVRTPLLYPSGSGVVIHVSGNQKSFLVTDMGFGHKEADLMGAGSVYVRQARSIAQNAGIRFDSDALFVLEVSRERLPGAITVVANCSQEAVAVAAYKLAERRTTDMSEQLYERLARIFTPRKVTKNAMVRGSSNIEYHVAALVTAEKRTAIFEAVANHPLSVAAANSKFNDIQRLKDKPAAIAVVRSKRDLGAYVALLSQTAHVIESKAPDEKIAELTVAA